MDRQATPLLVTPGNEASKLLPLDLTKGGQYDEAWLQRLIHQHPSLLPISSIEAAFWPAKAVCIELSVPSGNIDNLLVTPRGDLIVVECKLWRNVEARRKVIAQIIDYAKDLQKMEYADLENAVRKRRQPSYTLFRDVAESVGPDALDESSFIDNLSRNLRRGRMLLLVIGDGITENVTAIAEFLQQHAGLHFALALIRLSIYEVPGQDGWVVVPSIPLRTSNVVRGIVEWGEEGSRIVAAPNTPRQRTPTTLTDEQFFSALDLAFPGTSDRLLKFLETCKDLQIDWEVRKTLIVRMAIGEFRINPFVVNASGTVDTGYNVIDDKDLLRTFTSRLATAIPGTIEHPTPKTWIVKKKDGSFFNVQELLDHADGVRGALEVLNEALKKASAS